MKIDVKLIGLLLMCSAACLAVEVGDYPELKYDIYVDATTDNLWPSNDANYPSLTDWSYGLPETTYTGGDTTKWYRKTNSGAAINGTAFQGFGLDLPQLTMTLDGLDSTKVYDVYAICWVKKHNTIGEYWYADSGIGGNSLKRCDYYTAATIFNEGQFVIQGAQVYLGQVSGVTSCTVEVDGPYTNSSTSRAWFDGIALVEAKIETVSPVPGQHDYTDSEVVALNAYDYVDCPEYYTFLRWIGDVADPYLPQTTIVMDSEKTVTAVFNEFEEAVCGDLCHPVLPGDVTKDCMVDMDDLMIVVNDWLGHIN